MLFSVTLLISIYAIQPDFSRKKQEISKKWGMTERAIMVFFVSFEMVGNKTDF
jgi:hypothetical protein